MSESINLKFSGHDTFHCKEQWLLKGYQQVSNQLHSIEITSSDSIVELGVGKNMVRAISHWLKAFGLINHENQLTDFARLLCQLYSIPNLYYRVSLQSLELVAQSLKYYNLHE